MRIFLDENMPYKLVKALRAEKQDAESVYTLDKVGIKNGELFRFAQHEFDLLFTKDVAFCEWAKKVKEEHRVKYVLVTLPQSAQDVFVRSFITTFLKTNWQRHVHGQSWPK